MMKNALKFLLCLVAVTGFAQVRYDEVSVQDFQNELTSHYADSLQSPLTKEDLAHFQGLDFFPPDAKYFIIASFKRTKNEKPFKMKTSTDRLPVYVKYGEVSFTLEGKSLKLNLYQSSDLSNTPGMENRLFLPFSDLTNGKESYIGGRYIDATIPKGDAMAIDFNKSYNPYCAYNYKYSCPIVPLENDLDVAIKAGVKKFHD